MKIVQAEYVCGNSTLRQLSKKYGVTFNHMRNVCHQQGWVALRAEYRARVCDEAIELSLKRDVRDLQLIVTNSVKLLKMIEELIADPDSMRRYVMLETHKEGGELATEMAERTFKRVDMAQLKGLVDSQRVLTDGLLRLYQIPSQAEREAQKIAQERLELEREKFEAEKAKESEDREIVVRMELPEGFDA